MLHKYTSQFYDMHIAKSSKTLAAIFQDDLQEQVLIIQTSCYETCKQKYRQTCLCTMQHIIQVLVLFQGRIKKLPSVYPWVIKGDRRVHISNGNVGRPFA